MKKVVLVSGSSRKGNTHNITKIYADNFSNSGCSVNIIDLSCETIAFCDGCLSCDETQECKNDSTMKNHIASIMESDLVVFGTPARWALLSGELKTFIDRLNPYASCEGYAGKRVFVFASGQSEEGSSESIDSAIHSVLSFTNDAGMILSGTRKFCELLEEEDYNNHLESILNLCCEDVKICLKDLRNEEI